MINILEKACNKKISFQEAGILLKQVRQAIENTITGYCPELYDDTTGVYDVCHCMQRVEQLMLFYVRLCQRLLEKMGKVTLKDHLSMLTYYLLFVAGENPVTGKVMILLKQIVGIYNEAVEFVTPLSRDQELFLSKGVHHFLWANNTVTKEGHDNGRAVRSGMDELKALYDKACLKEFGVQDLLDELPKEIYENLIAKDGGIYTTN